MVVDLSQLLNNNQTTTQSAKILQPNSFSVASSEFENDNNMQLRSEINSTHAELLEQCSFDGAGTQYQQELVCAMRTRRVTKRIPECNARGSGDDDEEK